MRYLSGEPKLLPLREPQRIPFDDVPTGRIGAMGVTAGTDEHSLFKPYVYRGTGEDQHPLWTLDPPKPRKQPKHSPAKVRAANIKRAKKYGRKKSGYAKPRRRTLPRDYQVHTPPLPPIPEPVDLDAWGPDTKELLEEIPDVPKPKATPLTPMSESDIDSLLEGD